MRGPSRKSPFVVVANRLPVDRVDGDRTARPTGARRPVGSSPPSSRCSGRRTASGSAGPGRRWTTTRPSRPTVCTWSPSSSPTSRSQEYYEGMSNATLWPLYHDLVAKPEFHREWWEAYVQVNQRFAEAAVEAAAKDGVVWVQDYQLQLVPAMLRRSCARPADRLLPAHPVPADRAVQAAAVARPDPRRAARRRPGRLPAARRRGQLRPAGARAARAQDAPRPDQPRRRPRGLGPRVPDLDRRDGAREARCAAPRSRRAPPRSAPSSATRSWVLLGVDRLDYTKGIRQRLRAFGELIVEGKVSRRGGGVRPGRLTEPRAGRPVQGGARRHRALGRPDQRRPRADRSTSRSTTCTRRTPARRWPRCSAPPTSWS